MLQRFGRHACQALCKAKNDQAERVLALRLFPAYCQAYSAEAQAAIEEQEPVTAVDTVSQLGKLILTLRKATGMAGQNHLSILGELEVLKEKQSLSDNNASRASAALQAFSWHRKFMDETPEGLKLKQNWQRQVLLETRAVDGAALRYQRDIKGTIRRGDAASLPAARLLVLQWFRPLTEAIREEQKSIFERKRGIDRSVYGPYLLWLEPEELSVITLHSAINAIVHTEHEKGSPLPGTARMARVATAIGYAVETQDWMRKLKTAVHKDNMRQKKVQESYKQGYALATKKAEQGELSADDWRKWLSLGEELREQGEMLSIDHNQWFALDKPKDPLTELERKRARLLKTAMINTKQMKQQKAVIQQAKQLLAEEAEAWPPAVTAKIGVVLIRLLTEACKIDVRDPETGMVKSVPAFWHKVSAFQDNANKARWKKYGLLYGHPAMIQKIQPRELLEAFIPRFAPMLVEPVPWQRLNVGGHITLRRRAMRTRSKLQLEKLKEADREMLNGSGEGLSRVYEALNALGSTPWTINTDILKVVDAIMSCGGGVCDLPSQENVVVPSFLQRKFSLQKDDYGNMRLFTQPRSSLRERAADIFRAKKFNAELHSLRCDTLNKINIAKQFAEDVFYFPHNVDFRGRAYPMHPHLNHLGSDLCRGLLQFADAKPLGAHGLGWLYIQAADLWGQGVDKLPLEGRVKWVEDNLATIITNAEDPFREQGNQNGTSLDKLLRKSENHAGQPIWHKAENPFQFLATCYEIRSALSSQDPPSFLSRLPVHQDGSCNGLQHYAALGRDAVGGEAVNLTPKDCPQDVYSGISALVEKKVAHDAAAGVPEAIALQSSTSIDRPLVKQTVMTSVYGVTFVGARSQIGNRLRERGFEDNTQMYKVACYAAKVTLDSLMEMFQNARNIMTWLAACAREVAMLDECMTWKTPLGLPVVQPYRKKSRQHVRTVLQRLVLEDENTKEKLPVLKNRQRTAFPPNFIHSIDSTHMMMTAIGCKEAGLAFAGVHDSFWTHAGDVDEMNRILRDKFVELHSQPLLEDLLYDLRKAYPDADFPELPPRGDLDLDKVKESIYFFS